MTLKNKKRLNSALTDAANLIAMRLETGLSPEDVNEKDEKGLEEYGKACERAAKLIMTLAKKYEA